ncbi:nucleolar GTP-binding protein 2 [Kipferlia bialata]|uniref:Nucleolar GTP-binding protein 2 n=1 Tax=Kipferlia bialata TaxID=797122 RepID=A0A391NVR3_9EUKA|nr:nucleolar GTP-binding protein 2 [Kipferlia bialata]|eukprot:g13159.t1
MPSGAADINPSMRSKSTSKRIRMQRERSVRDKYGRKKFERYHNKTADLDGRIAPSMKWFGNTRVIGQTELADAREAAEKATHDPKSILIKAREIPVSLIREKAVVRDRRSVLTLRSFEDTFGPKATRKRPNLPSGSLTGLQDRVQTETEGYSKGADALRNKASVTTVVGTHEGGTANQDALDNLAAIGDRSGVNPHMLRGQTKRVYSELYKFSSLHW